MTLDEAIRFIADHGIVLEAAHGPVPSLLEVVIGKRPRKSWWSHPGSHEFFVLTRAVRRSQDVLVCRLVTGKVTFVHRRLWPALARLQRHLGASALQSVDEVHTRSGTHRVVLTPFRRRVPSRVFATCGKLRVDDALVALGAYGTFLRDRRARRGTA